MKKILLIITLIISLCLITGCGKTTTVESLDLSDLENRLDKLNDGTFYPSLIDTDSMEEFSSSLTYIYDFEYEELFGIDNTLVSANESSIKYNSDTKQLLAIIKPTESDVDIKKSMDSFCDKLESCLVTEYEGYLIYISSDDNKAVLENIKNTKAKIFNNMLALDDELFESTTGISPDMVDEYLMKMPMMMTSSSTYIIVKPKAENYDEVKSLLDKYMESLESTWEMYLPDQYDLVKNRLELSYGDYLIYVVSSDNDLVENEITKG